MAQHCLVKWRCALHDGCVRSQVRQFTNALVSGVSSMEFFSANLYSRVCSVGVSIANRTVSFLVRLSADPPPSPAQAGSPLDPIRSASGFPFPNLPGSPTWPRPFSYHGICLVGRVTSVFTSILVPCLEVSPQVTESFLQKQCLLVGDFAGCWCTCGCGVDAKTKQFSLSQFIFQFKVHGNCFAFAAQMWTVLARSRLATIWRDSRRNQGNGTIR